MSTDIALRMVSELLWTGLLVCLPLLGITMLIGLAISIIQTITQIQEMSLTFVPKLLTAGVVIILAGPWMLKKLTQFMTQLWTNIPNMF
ncbi:flagellar biosynthetic protein FliQ [Comamonas sediminis]|uniref:Flagellar biosynthetic protein FliQ n=1 Tax=Comamonas sediminis TaxID=1783360 RepID=A0ABV4B201_9BURK